MIYENMPYSLNYKDKRLMDIYQPENQTDICLLFIHGGGWWCGDKRSWHEVALHFYSKNYVCVSINYRLVPEYVFPSQIEDTRLAVSYIKTTRGLFEKPMKIIAIGSSAGGHLTALLSTINSTDILGNCNELVIKSTRPDAAVCLCPITRVGIWENSSPKIAPMMQRFIGNHEFDDPSTYSLASPVCRIKGDEPPFLFIHGDEDDVIPMWHSSEMYNKLPKNDLNKLVILKGAGHGFGYGIKTDAQISTLYEIEQFVIRLQKYWNSIES